MLSTQPLFRPFHLRHLTLANRIVMAPMTRTFSPGGVPGPDVAAYYRRRAENGVGLILTEGTQVLAGVHAAGGRMMPQLWHVGMMRKSGDLPNPEARPIGPSGIAVPAGQLSEPMTEAEIETLIAAYAQGAADAQRLGFDGVELHGAHGYLIDQFFWEKTNRRTDRWGGDLAGRTRFAAEAVRACRRAVGPEFPILLRFSQWKIQEYSARLAHTPDALGQFLAPLVNAGVDIFHCSTRRHWEPEFEGSDLNLAGWTKKLSGKPVITVGSVGLDTDFMAGFREGKGAGIVGLDRIVAMLERDEVDLVAVGRALLADPAWAAKIRDGRMEELRPFTVDAMKVLA
jgi:2,4-dienoyl-CoA reductase-like NADH-dependent reductase (Old Yellow Enzyme family)